MMTQDPYRRRPGHTLANLVEAGRDFVHGAAGARPGSRRRRGSGGISQVSRWVGEGINWLLEDDPDGMAQEEAPWTEPLSPPESAVNGERRGRPGGRTRDPSGMEAPWSHQGNNGSRRRPLQVIPHPAPPLLQQAEPAPEQESRRRHGGGSRPSSRPRPRSSRRIGP